MNHKNEITVGRREPRKIRLLIAAIALVAILVLAVSWLLRARQEADRDDEHEIKRVRVKYIKFPELPKARLMNVEELYFLRPLQKTKWHTAEQASYMQADDLVFALYLNGRAWVMPWWVIKNHHVANLTLNDQPVLMTFCEICTGSSAFIPVLDGKRYMFRVKGVYNGTHFIADDETGSCWTPFVGEAVLGPLKGSRLKRLPLYECTWAEWLALHPESLVADGANESRDGHAKLFTPGKDVHVKDFMKTLLRKRDRRLPENELVLGVEINGRFRAYPLATLDQIGLVVNDTLSSAEILIMHKTSTLLTSVFSRRFGNEVLVFENASNNQVVDRKYKSAWNYDGEAYAGTLAGQKLSYVSWTIEEWFTWAASHPQTEIFDVDDAL